MKYGHLADEELIVRGGDALDALTARYHAAMASKARTFRIHGMSEEDVLGEMRLGFAKAIGSYKPDAGSKFRTYWRRVVDNHMSDLYRHADRDGAIPISKLVSIATDAEDFGLEDIASDEGAQAERIEAGTRAAELASNATCIIERIVGEILGGRAWDAIARDERIPASRIEGLSDGVRQLAISICGPCDYALRIGYPLQASLFVDDHSAATEAKDDVIQETIGDVLRLTGEGHLVSEIADILDVSVKAVSMTLAGIRGLFQESVEIEDRRAA